MRVLELARSATSPADAVAVLASTVAETVLPMSLKANDAPTDTPTPT